MRHLFFGIYRGLWLIFMGNSIIKEIDNITGKRGKCFEQKKNTGAVVCSTLGTAFLIIVIVACLPLTVPRVFGYNIYTVISGSMEPAIPTGSLVYVKTVPAEEIKEKEIIAFYGAMDGEAIITHRVVANSEIMGEFITKGDANKTNDMNPIPYANYIGKVELSVPVLGAVAQTFTSTAGKAAAASLVGVAVLLEVLATVLRRKENKGDSPF